MKKYFMFLLVVVCFSFALKGQVSYTANDQVPTYTGVFRPGANFDYYPPYSNIDLANIAAGNPSLGLDGVGVRTSRPALYESFTEPWGLDFYVNDFQHFKSLGMEDLTMIVGFPSELHRDQTVYCGSGDPHAIYCSNDPYSPDCQSTLFANLYTPIWDDGANGTPYNDTNYLAAYMYEMVTLYKDDVTFWEIWNQPGFDHSYVQGWQLPGGPGNWWDNDPSPCANHFHAPIQHFIRTLRICYDVIKTVDPDAYVTLSGIGYESFLDAVLRNTDNPLDGSVTADYPLKGGAYFDCMGLISYPDIDGSVRYWDMDNNEFVYERHSDKAAYGLIERQNKWNNRLAAYGYDGTTYPVKEWIVSEFNAPRKAFNATTMASEELQVNYIIKALVNGMRQGFHQMNIFQLADRKLIAQATSEFDLLGLYKNFTNTLPYNNLQKTQEGIAYSSCSHFIAGTTYDAAKTAAMNLPSDLDGAAFYDASHSRYKYILWAKTTQDLSETASGTYSFPDDFDISSLTKKEWDFSVTNSSTAIDGHNIALTGRPVFLAEYPNTTAPLVINCPDNTTNLGTANEVVLDWPLPLVSTSCANDSITLTQVSGLPLGTTLTAYTVDTIVYEAADSCGHSATCQFVVTAVIAAPALSITCPGMQMVVAEPGENTAVVSWDESDIMMYSNCGNPVLTQLSGLPSGSAFPVGLTQVQYLAVVPDCQDSLTLSSTCSMAVFVFGQANPTITDLQCPTDTIILGNESEVTLDWDLPTATTSCATSDVVIIEQTAGPAPGTTYDSFVEFTVQYAISDSCGEYLHCQFNVTGQLVIDTPQINMVCPPDTTVEVAVGSAGKMVEWSPDATQITTNCGTPKLLQLDGLPSGSIFPTGDHTVEQLGIALYKYTDAVTQTCAFTIHVVEVVGLRESDAFAKFDLYPNPADGAVKIELAGHPTQQIDIEVIDQVGRIYWAKQYPFSGGWLRMMPDWSSLPSGLYLVRAKTPNQLALKTLTILRD